MIGIILAGGFAKRMKPLTYSKPLLPIGDKPCIEHICNKLSEIDYLEKIYITTNKNFEEDYTEWLSSSSLDNRFELVIERSKTEKEKIGALGAIVSLINQKNIREDIFVSVGDNYFDYSLSEIIDIFNQDNLFTTSLYDIKDKELVKKYSSVILNNGLIKEFEEKPLNPKSTLISTVNYICPKTMLRHIHDAVLNGLVDAPGKLLEYLLNKNVPVKGITLEGTWMDIGDRISYLKANFSYLNNSNFINKQAKIDSLSHIGKNVILSKDCMIQDSIIENSIVLKGAIIKSSRIINSIIGANSSVYSAEIKDMIYEDIF